jgi:hypothetical protein
MTEQYAIFANGIYWGIWPARDAYEATRDAAQDEGRENDIAGLTAHKITESDEKSLRQWVEDGCPAGQFPLTGERTEPR